MADQSDVKTSRGPPVGPIESLDDQSIFIDGSSQANGAQSPVFTKSKALPVPIESPSDESPPAFVLLNNISPSTTDTPKRLGLLRTANSAGDSVDEEATVPKPFERSESPRAAPYERNKVDEYEKLGDSGICKMHEFSLYETATRFLIVGADVTNRKYRILKIDRTADVGTLNITEDEIIYNKKEMSELLNTVEDGNKSSGGMRFRCSMWGLLGFIRFTGPYYMLLITKRSRVAVIGGHYVYQVDGTELIPLTPALGAKYRAEPRNPEESRFLAILNNLDLSRSFYFSNTYNITHTLQHNVVKEREALIQGLTYPRPQDYNSMFVWNNYLLQPTSGSLKNPHDWCLPVIHGYIDQAALSIYGRSVYITVIARRSRYFAGARFLKRGANDLGYVANDVETEQIVADCLTTSFHAPGPKLFANPNYTSYVQHRGSIPLYWTQENTGVTPKPPIELNLVDPFYSAAALHFDNLFERYGAPIYVLNLVKARERTPRESKLLAEFTNAINYLNQFLPADKKIIHKAWDMSRASKSRDQDVIGTLESIAEEVVTTTGFFRNGDGKAHLPTVQNGIARTNCIDCLDRTNAAQFVIGKRALGHQLHALGIIANTSIDYDTDAVNLFTHMFHDHGDTIAVQYGGSQLVNTMETYRKINQWTSHSRDMVESFKRYYNNSFLDSQRQEAYNLFLGNYIFSQGQPMLWDLATDYYLHHASPRTWSGKRRSYIEWYTLENLKERKLPPYVKPCGPTAGKPISYFDDYWLEFYRPYTLIRLERSFCYNINSTLKYIPFRSIQDIRYDLSPFRVRTDIDQEVPDRKRVRAKKEVTIKDPQQEHDDDAASIRSNITVSTKRISLQRWLQPLNERPHNLHGIMKETPGHSQVTPLPKTKLTSLDKSKAAQWTFTQLVHDSLNPSVNMHETDDYARYISHPQNLPLVVSTETPADINSEYLEYVNGSWKQSGIVPQATEEDLAEYADFLTIAENPLTVREEDGTKKRYKAYRKWLRGKSLFKQQPVD